MLLAMELAVLLLTSMVWMHLVIDGATRYIEAMEFVGLTERHAMAVAATTIGLILTYVVVGAGLVLCH